MVKKWPKLIIEKLSGAFSQTLSSISSSTPSKLKSSFSIEKSIGFLSWIKNKDLEK